MSGLILPKTLAKRCRVQLDMFPLRCRFSKLTSLICHLRPSRTAIFMCLSSLYSIFLRKSSLGYSYITLRTLMSTPVRLLHLLFLYVECGLELQMVLSCRVRLSSRYFNHDDMSYAMIISKTWIRLRVSYT